MEKLQFKISSFLKDLIGRELITDEFVAVFELVKNSFDANATNVQILFENQYNAENAKITIKDNGCGMNLTDLKDKWLFVGYSEKKEMKENRDYRDKYTNKRIFAGAKGVGRFSCDRLGSYLRLITKKNEKNALIENLNINWSAFEEDSQKEFVDIDVTHNTLLDSNFIDFSHGTILEITHLRDKWDRERLLTLKASLEKLINPIQENDVEHFSIDIVAPDEESRDELLTNLRKRVNGPVKNVVFESLGLKTTQIKVHINETGSIINTTLIDRSVPIYSLVERNPYDKLFDINISLFVLNRAGKLNFNKMMGISSVSYGSVFIYKNGFRIYPFGEEGDDSLKIDRRKQQGFYRYIGTRDLIGRIEINGERSDLKETTSRDGGLIKNESYDQLVKMFYDKALKRLENYTVGIIKWGDERFDKEGELLQPELRPDDVKDKIMEIITSLTKAEDVINIDYNHDFLKIYEQKQVKSASQLVKNFVKIAERTNNQDLVNQAKKVERSVNELKKAKNEAEAESETLKKEQQKTLKDLEQTKTENIFLLSDVNSDVAQLTSLNHHITHTTNLIDGLLLDAIDAVQHGEQEEALEKLEAIYDANQRIAIVSNYISKANFDTRTNKITRNIIGFVNQYVQNVYSNANKNMHFSVINRDNKPYLLEFSPLDMIIVIDNLLNNSKTSYEHLHINNMKIDFQWIYNDKLVLKYRDYAEGISDDILPRIFDYRFSTTSGGGLGLFHTKDILTKMGASIEVNNKVPQGVEFIISFPK